MNFHPKKRKTGNSAKFRPDSLKWTSDSATKNQWESVKIRIEGIFDLKFVDQCYDFHGTCFTLIFGYKNALFSILNSGNHYDLTPSIQTIYIVNPITSIKSPTKTVQQKIENRKKSFTVLGSVSLKNIKISKK